MEEDNGHDQIVQSGNYCNSSISQLIIPPKKTTKNKQKTKKQNNKQKITMTLTQTVRPNIITPHANRQGARSVELLKN